MLRRGTRVRNGRLANAVRSTGRWASSVNYARRYNRGLGPDATVLHFFPMRPHPLARITRICAVLGLRIGHGVQAGEPTIAWDAGTWLSSRSAAKLPPDAINGACLDISKSRVDEAWESVAGYSVEVDPLVTEGPLVIKSEVNSRHDGRIVAGPLRERKHGYVYQRLVDVQDGDSFLDLRPSIVGGQIATLVRCWRPANRWYMPPTRLVQDDPATEFSPAEMDLLLRFAARIGLDYGEVDVLRDKSSGLIYVVDANRTPYGPSAAMPSAEAAKVTARQAEAFSGLLASRWP